MKNLTDYDKGDELGGNPIRAIVGRNEQFMVCTVDVEGAGLGVHWITADEYSFSDVQRELIGKFNGRYDDVYRHAPADLKRHYVESLAQLLYGGLASGSPRADLFDELDEDIARIATSVVRPHYVAGAFVALVAITGLAACLSLIPNETVRVYVAACVMGALGSLISVLTKTKGMGVERFFLRSQAFFVGSGRIVLGVLYGPVAVLAAKAGVLFTVLLEKEEGVYLIAILAGFSERLVPDLLQKIEKQGGAATARSSKKTSG
jgi:hypothetical protein